ncbi:MAG: aldehyde reductase [Hyphomicrobiaceae bacterium]|nr:aldehyde reductase [Hyphomicrobiaceae bacterium]
MSETVVVTGATGFIAKHIIAELLRRGYAVRGTARKGKNTLSVVTALNRAGVDTSQLSFAHCDLLSDEGWDEAVKGGDHLMHTASPFPMEQPSNPDDVIMPAREGTLRVLRAAHRHGIGRVVLTSSTVAVMYPTSYGRDHVFSEKDFTDENTPGLTPYIRSKTIAEKAAWNFVGTTSGAPELTVINPGFVQGPALDGDLSTSLELYRLMARGIYPAAPRIRFPVCDVRDVAEVHADALVRPEAAGERFIVARDDTGLFALGRALAAECPELKSKTPKFQLPDTAVRAMAVFDKRLRTILPELGREKAYTSQKVTNYFGLPLRSGDVAIRDAIRSLRELGLI